MQGLSSWQVCERPRSGVSRWSRAGLVCMEATVRVSCGQSQCLLCSAGRFGNDTGLTDCIDCQAGRVQPQLGQVTLQLQLALVDSRRPRFVQNNCTICGSGTFMVSAAASRCAG